MTGCGLSSDEVFSKLIEMGFETSAVAEAVKEVGPCLDDAVDFILNGSRRNCGVASSSSRCPSINQNGKRILSSGPSLGRSRQSSILDHFQSAGRLNKSRVDNVHDDDASNSRSEVLGLPVIVNKQKGSCPAGELQECCPEKVNIGPDWEDKANSLVQKHFGYASLKGFQKEALAAWVGHQDCLVLAATGSGKSLCFQIPALLTGKVVVVISPLISLMHDQCVKLSKHGVSACFLGSGQPDSSVEQKAMRGMYQMIYVCPETVLRLMKPLQGLAKSRGIALFAIDEVHCVSKWGHDFRPDYRRLSLLRENFSAIPLMALTATATLQVREDIIKSLSMSEETKIVLTSFFRPNLRFSVKHSKTSSPSSYEKDFRPLIDMYSRKRKTEKKKESVVSKQPNEWSDGSADSDLSDTEDDCSDTYDELKLSKETESNASKERKMSVDYLENEVDLFQSVHDWDVACGEFCGQSSCEDWSICVPSETFHPPNNIEERLKLLQEPLEKGPTIIYVPTRKETLSIANYLSGFGVKAAAYNASLPKSHLRRVHKEFHENILEVVVATIAFGMGIDKSNVRRIIHYGWPQSLETYYQEAGRAGRDGKLAECTLYANLSRIPSLLPCKRSEEQTKQAHKMLSDCFRYGVNTSCCRAKILVEYFAEDFKCEKCLLCDVCVDGPPKMQNLKEEAGILMQIIASHLDAECLLIDETNDDVRGDTKMQKPNLRMYVSKIREQSQKFWAKDQLWWQGLARIMETKGYIREGDDKTRVQIKFPEPTKLGLEFLDHERDQSFWVYPEADMLLSMNRHRTHSTFADWGKGWADPEIRRQRLERTQSNRKPRKPRQTRMRNFSKVKPDMRTARGRIEAKLCKQKR